MIICPECKHKFTEPEEPCHKCEGAKFVTVEKKQGPLSRQEVVKKEVICPRCNASGLELTNNNRRSRANGAKNEYRAVDAFTDWWIDPLLHRVEFRKTPQSGGSQLAEGFDLAGDICCTDKTFPFHVEAKHTDQWDLLHLILRPDEIYGELAKYIKQAIDDAPKGKVPLLWLQHFGPSQPVIIMLFQQAEKDNQLAQHDNIWTGYVTLKVREWDTLTLWRYHILGWKKFITVSPKDWRNIASYMRIS